MTTSLVGSVEIFQVMLFSFILEISGGGGGVNSSPILNRVNKLK